MAWLSRVARGIAQCTSSEGGQVSLRQLSLIRSDSSCPARDAAWEFPLSLCHHPTFFFRCLLSHHSVTPSLPLIDNSPTPSLVSISSVNRSVYLHSRRGKVRHQLRRSMQRQDTFRGSFFHRIDCPQLAPPAFPMMFFTSFPRPTRPCRDDKGARSLSSINFFLPCLPAHFCLMGPSRRSRFGQRAAGPRFDTDVPLLFSLCQPQSPPLRCHPCSKTPSVSISHCLTQLLYCSRLR